MGRKDTTGRWTLGDIGGGADASALLDLCHPLIEAAPLPMAAMEGPQHRVRSVNPCRPQKLHSLCIPC